MTACLLMIALCGCAKTVTTIVNYGDRMTVEVTLRGTLEVQSSRYFLVLASSANYTVPQPPPYDIAYEMIEPGETPRIGAVADYYTKFYATWEGYVAVEPAGYFSVKGKFIQGQAVTREVITSLGEPSTKITFTFGLDRIFGTTIPANIYFDFVSVDWPSDTSRLPADHLTTSNAYVAKLFGSSQTITDAEDPGIRSSLDILDCKVTIQ